MCHAMELKQNPKLFSLYFSMLLFFTLKSTNNFFRYLKSQIIPDTMHLFQFQTPNLSISSLVDNIA